LWFGCGADGSADGPSRETARTWHGKTPREKADEYEQYLAGAIKKFPGSLSTRSRLTQATTSGARATFRETRSSW